MILKKKMKMSNKMKKNLKCKAVNKMKMNKVNQILKKVSRNTIKMKNNLREKVKLSQLNLVGDMNK